MEEKKKKMPQNRFLLIFVCIFLSFVIIFGATLGIILGVRRANTLVKYENSALSRGEVIYLASVFKSDYIAFLNTKGVKGVRDSASFWESESSEAGKSWGDLLNEAFRQYIAGIAIKNSLYLDAAKFGRDEKKYVKERVDSRLRYLYIDSKKGFNAQADTLGFDYDDLIDGSRLLCKADAAFDAIYGSDGTALSAYPSECAKYLDTYSHVSLIFLRTEDVYVLDESGKIQYGEDGKILKRELSAEERATRENTAAELREYIKNYENQDANAITPETFELYMREKSDTDPDMMSRGYYFNENAEVTAQFASVYPEVVSAAFDMEIGEYREVECSDSVCFIYRYNVSEGAYADLTNVFFSDFYIDGANYCFTKNIEALASEVKFSESFYEIDVVAIKANSKYVVDSWG